MKLKGFHWKWVSFLAHSRVLTPQLSLFYFSLFYYFPVNLFLFYYFYYIIVFCFWDLYYFSGFIFNFYLVTRVEGDWGAQRDGRSRSPVLALAVQGKLTLPDMNMIFTEDMIFTENMLLLISLFGHIRLNYLCGFYDVTVALLVLFLFLFSSASLALAVQNKLYYFRISIWFSLNLLISVKIDSILLHIRIFSLSRFNIASFAFFHLPFFQFDSNRMNVFFFFFLFFFLFFIFDIY